MIRHWIIMRDDAPFGHQHPTNFVKFPRYDEAASEAARLADRVGGTFLVYEVVGGRECPKPSVTNVVITSQHPECGHPLPDSKHLRCRLLPGHVGKCSWLLVDPIYQ